VKILILADEEEKKFWDYYRPGCFSGIDLILSAGDLKPDYLSFVVTMANRPVLYIHGNHDGVYAKRPPEGCDCIEDKLVTVKGLRILGLGGSRLYNGGPHQYSEKAMERRIRRLRRSIARAGGVDLVLTHSPAAGYGDEDNPAHRGFDAFIDLMNMYRPKYLIHGHVHKSYGHSLTRELQHGETQIINATGYYILELPDPPPEPENKNSRRPFLRWFMNYFFFR